MIRPNSHGSSIIERKASTDCTSSFPGGSEATAASSGASRPTTTSSRRTGSSRATTRSSSVAPTFDPQPPQRMATTDSSRTTSGGARPGGRGGSRLLPVVSWSITGSSVNRRMKRRSIQSFQRQTQAPSADIRPREATAYRSPVLTRLRNRRCGEKGRNRLPTSARRRLAASGAPWRTANTPAFSRG